MSKYYRFTVEGSGEFPWDMLRYDSCFPISNAHVTGGMNDNILNMSMCHHDAKEYYKGNRQVELMKIVDSKNEVPTEGRWNSFGWKIVKISFNK
jgi:hypothetical protein